jgi:hypothetical protein
VDARSIPSSTTRGPCTAAVAGVGRPGDRRNPVDTNAYPHCHQRRQPVRPVRRRTQPD